MSKIITVGLDLAKNVFQAHGADISGQAVLRKKLKRDQVLPFFAQLRPCVVAMPADAIATLEVLAAALRHLETEIGKLDAEIARRAKGNDVARRLMAVPGISPLIATAIAVPAPPPGTFRRARDFAAWLGLTPRQHSTGSKQRLGATTKMGERSLRRRLIIGANNVIIKRHVHASARPSSWLGRMLTRKLPMLVRVALANKTAINNETVVLRPKHPR